jgi:Tol biopolymer transport system component
MNRDGTPGATLSDGFTLVGGVEFSPNRLQLAVSDNPENGASADVWMVPVDPGPKIQFTSDPASDQNPIFTRDGETTIWNSTRKGGNDLYCKPANGTGMDVLLYEDAYFKRATSISKGGDLLYANTDRPESSANDLWKLPLSPCRAGAALKPRKFLATDANERLGQYSPDDQWVAYESDDSRRPEIYVLPSSGQGQRVPISHSGGTAPRWGRDSREIFYVAPNGDLMATEISVSHGTLKTGNTKTLFGGVSTIRGYLYDVYDEKGQKFIVAQESTESPPLTLVQNWTKLLKK